MHSSLAFSISLIIAANLSAAADVIRELLNRYIGDGTNGRAVEVGSAKRAGQNRSEREPFGVRSKYIFDVDVACAGARFFPKPARPLGPGLRRIRCGRSEFRSVCRSVRFPGYAREGHGCVRRASRA
jgi:hypothetical protein